jgi:hypothetical protein
MVKCKVCNKDFDSDKGLHSHISKVHEMHCSLYYHKYYPRYDKFSKELIDFKNKEYYFSNDFNSAENTKSYLKSLNKEERYKFICDFISKSLQARKEKHNSDCFPSHIELLTLNSLDCIDLADYFDDFFGNTVEFYNGKLCYNYGSSQVACETLKKEVSNLIKGKKNVEVLVDSREQQPITFNKIKTYNAKLDFGDYTLSGEDFSGIFIDRKSLNDFVGTMSGGFDRFERELKRADEFDSYVVVLVEESFKKFLNFKQSNAALAKSKITPEYIKHQMRLLLRNHSNVQFLFVDGRPLMKEYIIKLLLLKEECKTLDLQYCYDRGYL